MEDENLNQDTNTNETKSTYRKVTNYNEKSKSSFGKNVLLPFVVSVIGTTLVIGICFGVPEVKSKIMNFSSQTSENKDSSSPVSTAISLSQYSDTAISHIL